MLWLTYLTKDTDVKYPNGTYIIDWTDIVEGENDTRYIAVCRLTASLAMCVVKGESKTLKMPLQGTEMGLELLDCLTDNLMNEDGLLDNGIRNLYVRLLPLLQGIELAVVNNENDRKLAFILLDVAYFTSIIKTAVSAVCARKGWSGDAFEQGVNMTLNGIQEVRTNLAFQEAQPDMAS